MATTLDRRDFIKKSSALAASAAILPLSTQTTSTSNKILKVGFIGTGLRGRNHLNNILDRPSVECKVICDIDPAAITASNNIFKNKGLGVPKAYGDHQLAYKDMLEKEDLDAVIISTNWNWHTPMCLDAMEAGVYVGTEVSGAFSLDECWDLVETHQRTGTHLMFLENVCYRRDVMAILNMVREGLFGELLHCRGGYQHDLRHVKFDDGNGGLLYGENAYSEAKWRTKHSQFRNADLYPTHGLGPISTMLDHNRGNRLTSISSFATKARSIKNYVKNHPQGGEGHPYFKQNWALGDVVTSTITTARGETIIITHDTNLPRPYSLGFKVQGTKGIADFDYFTQRIHIEDQSESHQWDDGEMWLGKYDHKLWKEFEKEAMDAGHGGMDFFLERAFVESARNNTPPVLDVYDAAVWRSITPLSETSIRNGGAPQEIPDFTEGKWIDRKPIFGLGDY